jgi:hypothetical protein
MIMRLWTYRLPGCLFLITVAIQLASCGRQSPEQSRLTRDELWQEYVGEQAVRAVLRARLDLSRQNEPYRILARPQRELRLELGGVTLTRYAIREAGLNRRAKSISRDTTGIEFCEVPFTLGRDRWYEDAQTLALKDTTVIRSRPDTTGKLAEQIHRARVLSLLQFDRDLVLALHGTRAPRSVFDRLIATLRAMGLVIRLDRGEWGRLWQRRGSVFVEVRMEPVDVRSLAPNLGPGTRLILRF